MTSNRCYWLHALCILHYWDRPYRQRNRLQYLKWLSNVTRSHWQRRPSEIGKWATLIFSDKIFEMILKFGHGHLRWHNSIGHISLSISSWYVVTMCLYCIVSEILRVEYWQPLKSVWYCTYNYLRPYSRCLMLDNIVTLKFRLEVTHPANTCTVSTSLKSTDLRAIFLLLIVRVSSTERGS